MRLQREDTIAMARPPKVPRAISATETKMAPLDTTSFRDIPPQGPSSCRSTSSSQAHFLDGFNVDGCYDVRSLPDPPTPQARNRRRMSSPMLPNMRSLEDVTNQGKDKTSKGQKRNRRSLCHVPSPMEEEQRQDPISQRQSFIPPQTLEVSVCMDDEEELSYSNNKRRRKRQSMVLPKDLVEHHANTFATITPREEEPLNSPRQNDFPGDLESMENLQKLVRGFCSQPREKREAAAKAIEDTTGYPLRNPTRTKEDSSPDRKMALQQVYPVIQEMDKRKAEDTKMWERETGCRVEKSRSGKYRYRCLESDAKVSSLEYQKRYMGVLERNKALRLARADAWKAKLQPRKTQENEYDSVPQQRTISGSMDESDGHESCNEMQEQELNLNDVQERCHDHQRSSSVTPLPFDSTEDEQLDFCDLSVGLDLGDTTTLCMKDYKESETTAEPEDDEKVERIEPAGSQDLVVVSEREGESNKLMPVAHNSPTIKDALLPLPDRDVESLDPNIAKAERKLWNRIDAALHEYSREVMLIMKIKKPMERESKKC